MVADQLEDAVGVDGHVGRAARLETVARPLADDHGTACAEPRIAEGLSREGAGRGDAQLAALQAIDGLDAGEARADLLAGVGGQPAADALPPPATCPVPRAPHR